MSIRTKSLLEIIIIYIVLVGLILLNIYIYNLNIKNKNEIMSFRKKEKMYIKKILDNQKYISDLEKSTPFFKQKEKELIGRKEKLENCLLNEKNFSRLLYDIQEISLRNKIQILNLSQIFDESNKKFLKTYFSLDIVGNYENIVNFLGMCESLPYIMLISKFEIRKIDINTLSMKVNLKIGVLLKGVQS